MSMPRKPQISRVWIERKQDECPDLSHLGEYSNTPGRNCIDRKARGDAGGREYRYFIPAMTGEQTGNPDSPEQDYQRMEAYNRFEWYMMGIIAKAEVQFRDSGVRQTIRSGGIWGVESDGGQEYIEEYEKEEMEALADELRSIGFTDRQIKHAFTKVDR